MASRRAFVSADNIGGFAGSRVYLTMAIAALL
jgi:hypothetical protein